MNQTLHQKFTYGMWWNALEALPYHLILSLHNMALFAHMGAHTYGLVGTIFSLVFLAVGVANLGFDTALPTFLVDANKSKSHYKKIIGLHYAPTLCALLIAACVIPIFIRTSTDSYMPLLMGALIIVEGLKKGMRTLLHGAFDNKKTALIELFQIITYVTVIWTCFILGLPITVPCIFGTLLIVSTICLCMLAYHLYGVYSELPDEPVHETKPISVSQIIKQRSYMTVTSMSHQFFSGNALVPLFAYRFGLSSAGTLKLICSIAYGATLCIQKIFGSTTDALFAHMKYGELRDKQHAFVVVTRHLYAALYGVIIFGAAAIAWLYIHDKTVFTDTGIACVLLFFIIHVSEQFFMTYERFFITENRAGELMVFNGATLACLYLLFYTLPTNNPVSLLQAIAAVRMISFCMVGGVAFAWWRIRPRVDINPVYFFCSLALSLVCFLIIR